MSDERFSLKDYLFNKEKVVKISKEIKAVYGDFDDGKFAKQVLSKFPELELMERVYWIRDCLREFLPQEYREAVGILVESLPEPCNPNLSDDDFGSFIYSPYSYFVSEYGCSRADLQFSLLALKEMTTRFSVEGPIRFFLNAFPDETMKMLQKWSKADHYHVRRLSSEGTRPSLPWAKKISISHKDPISILDKLYSDKTRFVTRSVANHLNDISKIDSDLVVTKLKKWQKEGKQDPVEMEFVTRHSLRTLVKNGHTGALKLLGYSSKNIKVNQVKVLTPKVRIGQVLEFEFEIVSTDKKDQNLMVDYILYFNKANGTLTPKTFKINKTNLKAGKTKSYKKKHPLRVMTTRKLYSGEHKIELQINGLKFGQISFELVK